MKSTRVEVAPTFEPLKGAEMALIGDGKKMTFVRIHAQPGSIFPDHKHPNEQIGICIEGKGVLTSGGKELDVEIGVTWAIPGGEIHKFEVTGEIPVIIYEVWSPPREEYRKLARAQEEVSSLFKI